MVKWESTPLAPKTRRSNEVIVALKSELTVIVACPVPFGESNRTVGLIDTEKPGGGGVTTVRNTLSAKPFRLDTMIVEDAGVNGLTVMAEGLAVIAKSDAARLLTVT